MIMSYELDVTNYEDMVDLALPNHIVWNHAKSDEFSMDAMTLSNGCSTHF